MAVDANADTGADTGGVSDRSCPVRPTVTEYVIVATPSCAVTWTRKMFSPTERSTCAVSALATVLPLPSRITTAALVSLLVAATVVRVTVYPTAPA